MFKVGMKIVCVDDIFPAFVRANKQRGVNIKLPQKRIIYTIREIIEDACLLEEIKNDVYYFAGDNVTREPGFLFYHFRPLKYDNIFSELIGKIIEEKSDVPIKELETI